MCVQRKLLQEVFWFGERAQLQLIIIIIIINRFQIYIKGLLSIRVCCFSWIFYSPRFTVIVLNITEKFRVRGGRFKINKELGVVLYSSLKSKKQKKNADNCLFFFLFFIWQLTDPPLVSPTPHNQREKLELTSSSCREVLTSHNRITIYSHSHFGLFFFLGA
jgi:hypothetical protein